MSEETKKDLGQGTEVKPELPADFIQWQKKKEIDTKLDKMIQEKPEFKAIVEAGLREAVHKTPQLLELPEIFAEKVAAITEKLMKETKKEEVKPGATATDTKSDVKKDEKPGAGRPLNFNVAEGFDPQKHYCPKLESEDALREKGFSEVGIALVKAFG